MEAEEGKCSSGGFLKDGKLIGTCFYVLVGMIQWRRDWYRKEGR